MNRSPDLKQRLDSLQKLQQRKKKKAKTDGWGTVGGAVVLLEDNFEKEKEKEKEKDRARRLLSGSSLQGHLFFFSFVVDFLVFSHFLFFFS